MTDRIETQHPGALAETYARPLLALAEKTDSVDSVREQLDEILELLQEHPQLEQLFVHQGIDPDRRAQSIERLFKDRADDLVLRFLLVLNEHQRLGELENVRNAYDQALKASRNQVDVAVYTAQPLDDEQHDAVAKRLTEAIGREAIVHARTDEKLIGGLRIRFDDKLIDASVASQLRRIAQQVASQGYEAVREAAGRLLVDSDNGKYPKADDDGAVGTASVDRSDDK